MPYDITYMWNVKKRKMIPVNMYRRRPTDGEKKANLLLPKAKGEGRGKLGVRLYTLPHRKQTNNKTLLASTWNYTQYLVRISNGKQSEKEQICNMNIF